MREIPEEAYSGQISDYEFRLLAFLCRNSGHKGYVDASVGDMAIGTGDVSIKTVRRALQGLEEAGYIYRNQTKSMGGRRGRDKVYVVDKTVHVVTCYQVDKNVHTTRGQVTNDRGDLTSHMNHISQDSQISNKKSSNSVGIRKKEGAMPVCSMRSETYWMEGHEGQGSRAA